MFIGDAAKFTLMFPFAYKKFWLILYIGVMYFV